jgi:hypothetical protein
MHECSNGAAIERNVIEFMFFVINSAAEKIFRTAQTRRHVRCSLVEPIARTA